jgi:hypothetical protein
VNQDWVIGGTIAVAIVLVVPRGLFVCWRTNDRLGLRSAVGPVNFDFSKSFASTITALGALLTTILAAKGIVTSKTPHLTASSYAALSLFFGILVVVAPFVYRALSTTSDVIDKDGLDDIQYQGNAVGFLLAVLLTVWAVYGQLVTMFLFLTDIQSTTLFESVLGVIFALSAMLVAYYVWTVIRDVLAIKEKRKVPATKPQAARIASEAVTGRPTTPQLRTWSAL